MSNNLSNDKEQTIARNERAHIVRILEKCRWKMSGEKEVDFNEVTTSFCISLKNDVKL